MPVAASQRSILSRSPESPAWCRRGSRRRHPRQSARGTSGPAGRSPPPGSGRSGGFGSLSMTAIWAPSGRKARRLGFPGPAPAGPTGRQVVDEEVAILVGHGDPPAVRAESGRAPDAARVLHGDGAPVDVPDRQGTAGIMRGRQIAAVGAEAEDRRCRDRPGTGTGRSPGHRRRGGPRSSHRGTAGRTASWWDRRRSAITPGGRVMTRPVGLRSGRARQAIARSRSRANWSGGSLRSRAISCSTVLAPPGPRTAGRACRLNRVGAGLRRVSVERFLRVSGSSVPRSERRTL